MGNSETYAWPDAEASNLVVEYISPRQDKYAPYAVPLSARQRAPLEAFFARKDLGVGRFPLLAYLFLATASHGLLDAMRNGGLGVSLFSPFDNRRYFLPWRPILVSPISLHRFFSGRGYAVLASERLWVWLPPILFAGMMLASKRSKPAEALPRG